MQFFRSTPVLASQCSDDLRVSCCCLLNVLDEMRQVANTLNTMSGFSAEIAQLKRLRQQGEDQGAALVREYQALQTASELYERCERKNLQLLDGPRQKARAQGTQPRREILDQVRSSAGQTGGGSPSGIYTQTMVRDPWSLL